MSDLTKTFPLIGLTGKAGSGKSVVAGDLEAKGFTRVRFSSFLKSMLRGFYKACDLDDVEIERRIEGDLKEVPCPLLRGKTPRYAMQTLGTEWGRDLIGADIWSNAWVRTADKHLAAGKSVVTEDVRFPNEAKLVKEKGGSVLRIVRPDSIAIATSTHASEALNMDFDAVVFNTGTIEQVPKATETALRDIAASEKV